MSLEQPEHMELRTISNTLIEPLKEKELMAELEKKKRRVRRTKSQTIKLPFKTQDKIYDLVDQFGFTGLSDFVRDGIRKMLELKDPRDFSIFVNFEAQKESFEEIANRNKNSWYYPKRGKPSREKKSYPAITFKNPVVIQAKILKIVKDNPGLTKTEFIRRCIYEHINYYESLL